jgi:hypothetical protein
VKVKIDAKLEQRQEGARVALEGVRRTCPETEPVRGPAVARHETDNGFGKMEIAPSASGGAQTQTTVLRAVSTAEPSDKHLEDQVCYLRALSTSCAFAKSTFLISAEKRISLRM